ncbi:DLH domain-containing protein [Balamuthia mandrillaris]
MTSIQIGGKRLRGLLFSPAPPAPPSSVGAVFVGGAGGGVHGPAGIYPPLANRLMREGVNVLLLDYHRPNQLQACIEDTLEGIRYLHDHHSVNKVTLLGWSFGGAVVISAGALDEKVVGVATVASQTYGTDSVSHLGRQHKSLLLLHGTADSCLSVRCSETLFQRAHQPKELVRFPGDDHGLTKHSQQVIDKLFEWNVQLLKPKEPTA